MPDVKEVSAERPAPVEGADAPVVILDAHPNRAASAGVSKVKLALGAAGLFLFIVGVKRTFLTDDGQVIREDEARPQPAERQPDRNGRFNTPPSQQR